MVIKKVAMFLIRAYQKTISPDHGLLSYLFPTRTCRFHPSCSHYTYEAVDRFGALKGLYMGTRRVLRCHPWNAGGYDPVPRKDEVKK